MLKLHNLKVKIQKTEIIKNLSLTIKPGEIHAIMGPNGSGKSTLTKVITGSPEIEEVSGEMIYKEQDLLSLSPDKRAQLGIFLAFQAPLSIPGIPNAYFLRTALNSIRRQKGLTEIDAYDFLKIAKEKLKQLGLDNSFLTRNLNDGFSGGERKRNEIFQMLMLEPSLIILDEIDSGLDIDGLNLIAQTILQFKNQNRSFLIITHHQKLLSLIEPDFVHLLRDGTIIQSGTKELAKEIEINGYRQF